MLNLLIPACALAVVSARSEPYCGDTPPCRIGCPFGYVRDENGCAQCDCIWPDGPQIEPRALNAPPEPEEPYCGSVPLCRIHCPYGYVTDDNGCAQCKCIWPDFPADCAIPNCADRCNRYLIDDDGCPTCRCA